MLIHKRVIRFSTDHYQKRDLLLSDLLSKHHALHWYYMNFINQRKRVHLPEMTNGLSFF